MLKIIFMGTSDFSVYSLEAIKDSGHDLIAVVTQPDKPKGRGKHLAPPPVKEWAVKHNIPIFQPVKVRGNREFLIEIKKLSPDLIVTAAYGQILPKELLEIPPLGCINVHASLLPAYRGASPIQQVLINGEKKTGISIMFMDEGMDTGDVILQEELEIAPGENAGQLHDRLAALGGKALIKALKMFDEGKPVGIPQDHEKATYCSKIDKSMGEIKWEDSAMNICNLIRGLTPWPGAFTYMKGMRLKVWKASKWEYFTGEKQAPGIIIKADNINGLIVACGDGMLRIEELQIQGGRPMTDLDYLRGNQVDAGVTLGV